MKIKVSKTTTEEIEAEVPKYFKCYLYSAVMVKDNNTCITVFTAGCPSASTSSLSIVLNSQYESIKPITKAEFYEQLFKAIETMTGFKYTPETETPAMLNNFQGADEEKQDENEKLLAESAHEREQFTC